MSSRRLICRSFTDAHPNILIVLQRHDPNNSATADIERVWASLQYKETNEVDPYVRLSLFDPESGGTESFRSSTQMNDASPR